MTAKRYSSTLFNDQLIALDVIISVVTSLRIFKICSWGTVLTAFTGFVVYCLCFGEGYNAILVGLFVLSIIGYLWWIIGHRVKDLIEIFEDNHLTFCNRIAVALKWIVWIATTLLISTFIIIDCIASPQNAYALLGLFVFTALLAAFSVAPSQIPWNTVISGTWIQLIMGLIVMKWQAGNDFIADVASVITRFLEFGQVGAAFVFGESLWDHAFAMAIMPILFYFAAVTTFLYHCGLIQPVVRVVGSALAFVVHVPPVQAFVAVAEIFLGPDAAIVMVASMIPGMSSSGIHTLFCCSLATIDAGMLPLLESLGVSAQHLVSASLMSAPAAIVYSKLLYPELSSAEQQDITSDNVAISDVAGDTVVAVVPAALINTEADTPAAASNGAFIPDASWSNNIIADQTIVEYSTTHPSDVEIQLSSSDKVAVNFDSSLQDQYCRLRNACSVRDTTATDSNKTKANFSSNIVSEQNKVSAAVYDRCDSEMQIYDLSVTYSSADMAVKSNQSRPTVLSDIDNSDSPSVVTIPHTDRDHDCMDTYNNIFAIEDDVTPCDVLSTSADDFLQLSAVLPMATFDSSLYALHNDALATIPVPRMDTDRKLEVSKYSNNSLRQRRRASRKQNSVKFEKSLYSCIPEALVRGAFYAIPIIANTLVMLISFVSILEFINSTLTWFGLRAGIEDLTLQEIFSYLFTPLAFLMGVQWEDCREVARLLGLKTVINELVAYTELSELISNRLNNTEPSISARSETIATYALCGYSNIGTVGFLVGFLSSLAPNRKDDIAGMAFRALVGGSAACFSTACVAGLFYSEDSNMLASTLLLTDSIIEKNISMLF